MQRFISCSLLQVCLSFEVSNLGLFLAHPLKPNYRVNVSPFDWVLPPRWYRPHLDHHPKVCFTFISSLKLPIGGASYHNRIFPYSWPSHLVTIIIKL